MIPKEWKDTQLNSIANIILSNVDKIIKSHEKQIKLCNYLDVYNNFYITNNLNFMQGSANEREIKKYSLFKDDVIITKDSETAHDIANAAVVIEDLENTLCGYHLAIIRPNKKILDATFLMYQINHQPVNNQFARLANGITRFGLTKRTIEQAKIPIPPLSEQKRIVQVLSTWDEAITLTEQAIKAKEKHKKSLMHLLLTAKIRIPEFGEGVTDGLPNGWVTSKLKDIAIKIWIGLVTTMTTHYVEKGIPLIRNLNIKENRISKDGLVNLSIEFAQKYTHRQLQKNDIVTVHTGDIGTSAIINDDFVGAQGFATLNTRTSKEILPQYLCYFFNSQLFKKQAYTYSTGDGRHNLNLRDFVKTFITYPTNLKEQQAIVQILQTADEEISLYKQKLIALRQQKKGLMHILLTGKVRLS